MDHLNTSQIITDDGSENKGSYLDFIKGNTQIIHRIAQSDDLPQSNSCIESFFRTIKSHYIKRSDLNSYDSFLKVIDGYVHHYNYQRFRRDLHYRSPMETLLGLNDSVKHIPNKMKLAPSLRREANQMFDCSIFC